MITSVLFDMGGTLEDIYVDAESERAAIVALQEILERNALNPGVGYDELKARVDAGWVRYGKYRDASGIELKPVPIWCNYVLSDFNFPREILEPICEEIAHMWEVTHYHRALRPKVKEMLTELRAMGLKLSIISNTAAMYQVFYTLKDYGIRDFFQDVTLSSVTGIRKPRTDIFTVAMHQLQSAPEECVYVGDTVSRDIIGAKKAGFAAAIQILSKLTREKDVGIDPKYAPDYFIEDIMDVAKIVKELREKV